jgi:2-octaprenyl-3-methyl-6-methoxy-1,4-benzoquinol hydroxylase
MNRETIDVLVAGGGIVGSALALGLRQRGLEVGLLDPLPAPCWREDAHDLRVYALAADARALLAALGLWPALRGRRVSPYVAMEVWDSTGGRPWRIEAGRLGVPQLGHIVEHALLAEGLRTAALAAGVRCESGAELAGIETEDDEAVVVRLDDGRRLRSRWLFGADGAGSTVRAAAGIGMDVCDYAASGLVALLQPERPHAATCWQRFLPTGPLALLPCADGRVSIVWSLPEPEARRLAAAPAAAFEAELVRAADRVLGGLRLDSERRLFPLRRQLADPPLRGRVALFGDAAHVVHPLAGQGMNLGLRDVAGLFEVLDTARQRGGTLSPARLARWARRRRSENHLAAHAFEAIHRVYSNDAPLPVALRGWALAAANLPPLGRALWRHAAGL